MYTDWSAPTGAVALHDVSDGSTTLLTFGGQQNPGIGSNIVAYEDTASGQQDIYVVDLGTNTTRRIAETPVHDFNPSVGGTSLVFERANAANRDAILYDLSTDTETNLGPGRLPHTDGATVIFHGLGFLDQDIFLHDIASGTTTRLALAGNQTRGAAVVAIRRGRTGTSHANRRHRA